MCSSQLAHNLNDKKWRSEDINVTGDDESEVTFKSLNLRENVLSGLEANGFVRLSAIQLHAIPLGRCGLDLILQSKSGTGKTCVFVVIALELLEAFESNAIQVLVVCPTREIAVQTSHVITSLAAHSTVRSCPVIGGTKLKEDVNLLSKCQAVVGTPGRIKQLIELNVLKTNSIRLLVLDECDKLLDHNFRQQIDDIFESLPQNKQTIAVSATMTSELASFLTQYMRTPVFVRLNADNPALIGVKQFYTTTDYHHLNHMNFDNKIEPLIDILKNVSFSQCLVFSNYQTRFVLIIDVLNGSTDVYVLGLVCFVTN
jgi:superfamily II DNA/RNA helicase